MNNSSTTPPLNEVSDQCVIAQYGNGRDFEIAMEVLEKASFSSGEVSVVQHESMIAGSGLDDVIRKEAATATETEEPSAKGSLTAASTVGGVLGGALGAATAFGPLLIIGPLVGALAGAIGGSAFTAVDGWGVNQSDARDYELEVQSGKQLIIVSSHDSTRLDIAERALKTANHESIRRFKLRSEG